MEKSCLRAPTRNALGLLASKKYAGFDVSYLVDRVKPSQPRLVRRQWVKIMLAAMIRMGLVRAVSLGKYRLTPRGLAEAKETVMAELMRYDLTPAEVAGLCLLESGGMAPTEFYPAMTYHTVAGPNEAIQHTRECKEILFKLQRYGLANLAGTKWQVTKPGRELALRLQTETRR